MTTIFNVLISWLIFVLLLAAIVTIFRVVFAVKRRNE